MTFEEYHQMIATQLEPLREMLADGIPSQPGAAEHNARQCEQWYARLTEIEAEAKSRVSEIKAIFLQQHPKEKDMPDLDRRALADMACSNAQRFHDEIKGLVKAVEMRVSLAQSLLKSQEWERRQIARTV